MRIAKTIGYLTLSHHVGGLGGARLKIVVPMSYEDIMEQREPTGEEVVAWDEWNAGSGEWVALSEGAEAAQPFYPDEKPIDAYVAAILDTVEIQVES